MINPDHNTKGGTGELRNSQTPLSLTLFKATRSSHDSHHSTLQWERVEGVPSYSEWEEGRRSLEQEGSRVHVTLGRIGHLPVNKDHNSRM